MSDKYKLTNKTINYKGRTLYRVQALKDFTNNYDYLVKKGDLGGYIEKSVYLDQKGYSWVFRHAKVYGDVLIYGNASILPFAVVYNTDVTLTITFTKNVKVVSAKQRKRG